jgi:hypothetical protein
MSDENRQENRAPSAAGSTQLSEGARKSEGELVDLDSLARAMSEFSADLWRKQALSSPDLIASHKILLFALSMMFDENGYCFVAAADLAASMSSSANTVSRCGKVLEEKGWLTRKRRQNGTEYLALKGRDSP